MVSQLAHDVSDQPQNALIDRNQLISNQNQHRVMRIRNFPALYEK